MFLRSGGFVFITLIILVLTCGGCTPDHKEIKAEAEEVRPPTDNIRDKLSVDDLHGESLGLVHNEYFMPIGEHAPAQDFSGTLTFPQTAMEAQGTIVLLGERQKKMPEFSISFISDDGFLIPTRRGVILSGDIKESPWNIIVSPGKVWRESADNGFSRASFPFTLTVNDWGQVWNGLATFVYNQSGISRVFCQISQETHGAIISDSDRFGLVQAGYEPGVFPGSDEIIAAFQREMSNRSPVLPWSQLPNSETIREEFNCGMSDTDISSAALYMDGNIYLQPQATRTGTYPYPYFMRHGVYSISKTLCAGLSMFYLAERYGEGVFEFLISDYVSALSQHPAWQGVTFAHAVNMVTGATEDEDSIDLAPFGIASSTAEKLAVIAEYEDAPPGPGEVYRYSSTNTFVLSCAMNNYIKEREGPDTDLWLVVEKEVLNPIGIEFIPVQRTVEPDGSLGNLTMGWGCYTTVDAALKIAKLLQDEGVYQGVRLVSGAKIRQALYNSNWPGFVDAYKHSLRTRTITTVDCEVRYTYMSGALGNKIVLSASGLISLIFTDMSPKTPQTHLAKAAEMIQSSCAYLE
ncbi:MAG: hypothetical protein GY765_06215 [bacterium]|nr:hypothetical protein [bacterium]